MVQLECFRSLQRERSVLPVDLYGSSMESIVWNYMVTMDVHRRICDLPSNALAPVTLPTEGSSPMLQVHFHGEKQMIFKFSQSQTERTKVALAMGLQ